MTTKEELGLEVLFPPLVTYPLKGEVGIGVACVTLRFSIRKGRCVGNIQWGITRIEPTAWANLYGTVVLQMGGYIFSREGKKFTDTACPT